MSDIKKEAAIFTAMKQVDELRKERTAAPVPLDGERERFEQYVIDKINSSPRYLSRRDDDTYENDYIEGRWIGWQARAALQPAIETADDLQELWPEWSGPDDHVAFLSKAEYELARKCVLRASKQVADKPKDTSFTAADASAFFRKWGEARTLLMRVQATIKASMDADLLDIEPDWMPAIREFLIAPLHDINPTTSGAVPLLMDEKSAFEAAVAQAEKRGTLHDVHLDWDSERDRYGSSRTHPMFSGWRLATNPAWSPSIAAPVDAQKVRDETVFIEIDKNTYEKVSVALQNAISQLSEFAHKDGLVPYQDALDSLHKSQPAAPLSNGGEANDFREINKILTYHIEKLRAEFERFIASVCPVEPSSKPQLSDEEISKRFQQFWAGTSIFYRAAVGNIDDVELGFRAAAHELLKD